MTKLHIYVENIEWHGNLWIVRCPKCGKVIASGSSCATAPPLFSTCYCDEDDDFTAFVNILDNNGYAYCNYKDVKLKDGRTGTKYDIEKYPFNNPTRSFEHVKDYLIQRFGEDRLIIHTMYHEYAPEIKFLSITLIDE